MTKIYIHVFFISLMTLSVSCEDFLGGDINQDPNKSFDVPLRGTIGQIQIALADVYGGDYSRINCMFVQQVEGVARQWASFNEYTMPLTRFNSSWSNLYEQIFVELSIMKNIAKENKSTGYLAVIQTIEAFSWLIATDQWGDIPFSESTLGSENYHPVFDDAQSVIFPEIENLLDEALVIFNTDGIAMPGSDDLFYGGDKDKWIKAVNAIKARLHLRLGDYTKALAAAQASFKSREDNLAYQYGVAPNGAQWYRFNDGRTGDIEFHPTLRKMMKDLSDTDRLGVLDNTFITSHPYLTDDYRQDLISYREIQFLIAECLIETGGSALDINDAYTNGISASFEELGFAQNGDEFSDYISQESVLPKDGSAVTLNEVITQKYIGLFVQPEVFTDYRRTGLPSLTPVSGNQIPTRWAYSETSELYNNNFPSHLDKSNLLYTPKIFWNK